jgi:hypothetical protein
MEPKIHDHVHKSPQQAPVLRHMNLIDTFHFNIILSFMPSVVSQTGPGLAVGDVAFRIGD